MEAITTLIQQSGLYNIGLDNLFMYLIAGTLVYLAIRKEYEPLLLIPIGFGILLAVKVVVHIIAVRYVIPDFG